MRIDQAAGNHHELIMSAFNSATYIDDKLDVQHEPLYDTLTFAAAATISSTTARFFSNVGSASGKTLAQTNLTRPNQLPAPEAFSIFSIQMYWSPLILQADIVAILNGFALEFVIGKKPYNTGPLWHYVAGGGLFGTGTSISTNGNPGRNNMHTLAIPIVIENGADFEASLQGNNLTLSAAVDGGTGATLMLLFDGFHARGVQ